MSPKGKCPWITVNGQDVYDSQFCIEYLVRNGFGNFKDEKQLDSHLSIEQKAQDRAYRALIEGEMCIDNYFARNFNYG